MSAEYAFRITGRLTPALMGALAPLEARVVTTETLLVGRVTDRAELHEIIARIEALGLELIELQRLPSRPGEGSEVHVCPRCHRDEAAGSAPGTVSRSHR
ncbi:hypothetical protein [Pseudonocardia sp. H11422]|uniref:hypothetical protein n=1 Tax=Pseudonocardia sp. H11422 TaxID=2835866 RepID=UPI001BDD3C9F|nr:hypothetical protein [Pseudonocardia sp. H11422]